MYGDLCKHLGIDLSTDHLDRYSNVFLNAYIKRHDVTSDVDVNFKNVGVLSIESSLFHLFHYTLLQTKHQRKGY